MKNKIKEAAKQVEILKKRLYNTKTISLPNNGGDVFHTQEVMRYINGIEDLFKSLSQQEPIKGVEYLTEKLNFIKDEYIRCVNDGDEILETIEECLEILPHLRTSTQSEWISKDYANWIEENMWCKSRDTRFPKTYGRWYNTASPDIEKKESKTDDELFTEFQNSKGIKQNKE